MCKLPIEFSSLSVDGTEGKGAITDSHYGNDLRIVPRRENLIRLLESWYTRVFSITVTPLWRNSLMALCLVMPARNVPLAMGVNT
jgi:hypothetical protein